MLPSFTSTVALGVRHVGAFLDVILILNHLVVFCYMPVDNGSSPDKFEFSGMSAGLLCSSNSLECSLSIGYPFLDFLLSPVREFLSPEKFFGSHLPSSACFLKLTLWSLLIVVDDHVSPPRLTALGAPDLTLLVHLCEEFH